MSRDTEGEQHSARHAIPTRTDDATVVAMLTLAVHAADAIQRFALSTGLDPERTRVWAFGDNEAMATRLADLVVRGSKIATASLFWAYEHEGEQLPRVGDRSIVSDLGLTQPLAAIETTEVRTGPFSSVDADFAHAEGEGDRSIAYWRRVHWAFFSSECARLGRAPHEHMPVVFERFRLLAVASEP